MSNLEKVIASLEEVKEQNKQTVSKLKGLSSRVESLEGKQTVKK